MAVGRGVLHGGIALLGGAAGSHPLPALSLGRALRLCGQDGRLPNPGPPTPGHLQPAQAPAAADGGAGEAAGGAPGPEREGCLLRGAGRLLQPVPPGLPGPPGPRLQVGAASSPSDLVPRRARPSLPRGQPSSVPCHEMSPSRPASRRQDGVCGGGVCRVSSLGPSLGAPGEGRSSRPSATRPPSSWTRGCCWGSKACPPLSTCPPVLAGRGLGGKGGRHRPWAALGAGLWAAPREGRGVGAPLRELSG